MNEVTVLAEAIKYILPAVVVALTGWYLLQNQRQQETQQALRGLKAEVLRQHLPLKLSAYERAILFLERIQPQNLIPRLNAPGLNAQDFRMVLILGVREEYEHNIAQQLYISPESWAALVQAKEEILGLINQAGASLAPDDEGIKLGKLVLEQFAQKDNNASQKAIFLLKQDVLPMFDVKS